MCADVGNAFGSSLFVVAVVALAGSGCAQSESAEQPSETTAGSQNPSGEESADRSDPSKSSSDRDYENRPELRELEGETERLKARAEIVEIKNRIQANFLMTDAQTLPDDLSELTKGENPVIEDSAILRDPWGNRYVTRTMGEGDIEIFSPGPDGEPGTDDDVRASK